MRIVFLNTLYGELREPFLAFVQAQAPTTDVFCFQEAGDAVRHILEPILDDFAEVSCEKHSSGERFHQTTYIKHGIEIVRSGHLLEGDPDLGLASYFDLKVAGTEISLCNVHGRCYHPKSGYDEKLDTKDRLAQSRAILKLYEDSTRPVIIGGDFNILSEATSIRMFEDAGYQDLIKDYQVKTTRNHLIWDKYPDNPMYHSDYVFLSPDISVKAFEVPNIILSDHLPLILTVDLPSVSSEPLLAKEPATA